MNKNFDKNLIKSKEEEQFQSSNTCWICKKPIDDDNEKVRDHCHITVKFRGVAQVPVIFHKLIGYDSHLIFDKLKKFDVKSDVIPNRLEKFMVFF